MKKIIPIFLILILIGGGVLFYFYKDEFFKDKKKQKEEPMEVIESSDLFGTYYTKANAKLKKMTLEEKIGQLFLVRYDTNLATTYINKYHAGGLLLFAKDFDGYNKKTMKTHIDELQKSSDIPLAIAADEEGGYVTRVSRYKEYRDSKFLSPKSYFEEGGYDLLEQMEREKAKMLLSIGVNFNLAPVADISTDEDDFIYIRSFGRDAAATSEFIKNMVTYAREEKISSCLKHFPGYGNNEDTHTGVAIDNRPYENFEQNDYLPFMSGIDESVPAILVSHNVVNCMDPDYPSSLSKKVITGELREKLHFSGIVLTDDLDMDAVKEYAEGGNAATLAINAGADMIITSDLPSMYQELLDGVKNKEIEESTIDKAVLRILAWKEAYQF
ncbi:MAG: beta-hexosaminidase [Bacilli bacterium]|nr:beta-hexosaminidase [Bacilli bacterium]